MTGMLRLPLSCLALRLLLVAMCVWPATSTRQLALSLGIAQPPTFANQAPVIPINEEEEHERAQDAKNRMGPRVEHRPDPPRAAPRLSLPASVSFTLGLRNATHSLLPADALQNGLGTHYRC